MQFYYGNKNILRALDEADFWKRQEAEHAIVIQLVAPDLEREFSYKLKEFGQEFNTIHSLLVRATESVVRSNGFYNNTLKTKFVTLIQQSIQQSKQWVEFLEGMLKQSESVRTSAASQTVIHHIIRESQYFIGIEQLVL